MAIVPSVVGALASLTRKCPKCHREQAVPASKADQTVKCKHCGKDIPPKKR